MEVTGTIDGRIPLWKKYLPIFLVTAVGSFSAGTFFMFMIGLSENPDVINSVFAGSGGWMFAAGIGSLGGLIFVLIQLKRKQVCAVFFDDDKREIEIHVLPYWTNTVKQFNVPYSRLRFTTEEYETIQAKDSESIMYYDELVFIGRMTHDNPVWKLHPKSFKKVKGKLERLKGGKKGATSD